MNFKGIHHVSAITADAARNVEFYTDTLGMRLIKKTVNQDATSMYHLFYGDETGSPGTELTFFEIPMAAPNHHGNNSISRLSLRVPSDEALRYWQQRFTELGVTHSEITDQGGRSVLPFEDFERQRFFLISDEGNTGVSAGKPWAKSPVPAEYAITGLGPVHLTVPSADPTAALLTDLMGFRQVNSYPSPVEDEPDVIVFETGEGGTGAQVHVHERPALPRERQGRGGVHHVAFRVEDEEALREWISRVRRARIGNSGFVDRFYFKSLYFREPNGILYEVATDGPGFATDEDVEHLGESLALPPFLEPQREQIEAKLKPLPPKK